MHLPKWTDAEYVAQLTAEKAVRKYVKGWGAVPEWIKLRQRNETLDLEGYALAGFYILGTDQKPTGSCGGVGVTNSAGA
jgi:phage terminase large subunit GpA-like protein